MRLLALAPLVAVCACSSGDLPVGSRNPGSTGDDAGAAPGASIQLTNRASAIPIGVEDVNNSPMKTANYRALLRFVPDHTLNIDRVYFGFNIRGADCRDPGGRTDGSGDGGVLEATLVDIDATTGLPGAALDGEAVDACARYNEAVAEVDGAAAVLVWANLSATLEAGEMYGLVVRNAHTDPENNYFSFSMPTADAALAGPQARNELDINAPGAILSLDPREHVAWSEDGGASWRYGVENGQYPSFINDDTANPPATRVPQYGFRLTDGTTLSPQPYYAYNTDCAACTAVYANARYARSFTQLGGFTASGTDVGVLTISNLESGDQASCTPTLGYGFRTCEITTPFAVAVGESYEIAASGTVELMHMNSAQQAMFPSIGTSEGNLRAYQPNPSPGTDAKDVPSLWAGPLSGNFPLSGEE